MRRSLVALLIVLGSLPQAVASATSQGEFVVAGDVLLPTGTQFEGSVHAWVVPDSSRLDRLTVQAPKLKVEYHVRELVALARGDRVERGHTTSTYDLTGATLVLSAGDPSGEMGFYPQAGVLGISVESPVAARPRVGETYTTYEGGTLDGPGSMRDARYRATVLNPHFDLSFDGVTRFLGAGSLVLFGPDVTIRARENTTHVRTGESSDSGSLAWPVRQEWLVINFGEGRFEASGESEAFRVALSDVAVAWRDMAVFEPLTGSLRAGTVEYRGEGGPAYVSGDFEGTLTSRSLEGGHATLFSFGGELWSTNLAAASVAAPAPAAETWPLLLGLASLGGAGGLVGFAALRRRRAVRAERPPAPIAEPVEGTTPEACLAAANRAAEIEDWETALIWVQKGRYLAPTSVKLRLDEAFFLSMLGRLPEAFRRYEEAVAHSVDGEAAYSAAVCAAQHGRPPAEIERWLVAALARSPELALEVAEDCFKEVVRRPLVREAVEGALDRLRQGEGLAGP